jgi:sporulation protein YlmC with PRC-barrel domain
MIKRYSFISSAAALALLASGGAFAADDMTRPAPLGSTPPAATGPNNTTTNNTPTNNTMGTTTDSATGALTRAPDAISAKQLIGAYVENSRGDKIGDVNSVYLDRDGKVRSVILGVGGFLGMGEHDVSVNWDSLSVSPDGKKLVTSLTKDQLQAMPEYKYADNSFKGKVFNDTGVWQN